MMGAMLGHEGVSSPPCSAALVSSGRHDRWSGHRSDRKPDQGVYRLPSRRIIASAFSDAIVFVILIIVLLVKPSGIMGRNEGERV